ncbi:hypothetical protein J5J86_03325 [Aquabacter sp. L1I39]|uniref:hypothetical protein n=1 Tax=Aquabacter sp. L1I39 TaxID=2820278 RepID=UPI001ADA4DF5|nr:hypothetical protein [Aquabacter sp. L1I39]QTL04387.1 hypothetical protein J5J86_03325 [Aquabacter sp. L1I39]
MSIKTLTIVTGIALTLAASANAAFADIYIGPENQEQYAVSAQETLFPTANTATVRQQREQVRPSTFGTPGPYYVNEAPFQSNDPHSGSAHDADMD